ncbi:protein PSK SIMULATOR 1 [Ziziphus jujuba]|uniref:Protein PSK SIMULATOR 1 n=2 Tax=Ziziphus jujuba TaxID=326968 RepID=A0A6P3ZMB5_ZIZJJ|nr:protein PSK SIMULATOR 1 [Ziziphus jujuba]XP_048326049.1 protein PSK SIMULATOR 1 [Ziziphus jujuba]KAH7537012.1 hypothetical protein FEM48_Zijuj03G0046900 [Ziziphus jujuba var. spinosa]
MVADSWFRSLWKTPKRHEATSGKAVIGVLAFEVASLMSKLVYLCHTLSDKQVNRLREEITRSMGIKKLVSEDDTYIAKLICDEMIENVIHVAKSVARLGKKCSDPSLKNFEKAFCDFIDTDIDTYGWQFTWKKMEKKAKKMERFISVNSNLYQEMEVLTDLEQTLRRMKGNDDSGGVNVLEFQKKVTGKQQDVKYLKSISLWNRTYDYTVLLLARSLFTIFRRVPHVFGMQQIMNVGETEASGFINSEQIHRSQSVSALLQTSIHPSNNGLPRFASGPLDMFAAKSGPISKPNKTNNFYSGPLVGSASATESTNASEKYRNMFYSGPLGKSTKSGPFSRMRKTSKKIWGTHNHANANEKKSQMKSNRLTQVGPFKGCMMAGSGSPVTNCHLSSNSIHSRLLNGASGANTNHPAPGITMNTNSTIFKSKFLDPPPDTLGAAALALHYANVIIVIEKLASSPHLIGLDARDDLYNMLPASVRNTLRAKLKPHTKSVAYDTELAKEWNDAMSGILEWLAPLAHNMIRWQSERSYEQQSLVSRTNVLLVQTLYFANQEKTEETIIELLVGLNYIWRLGREFNANALLECASSRIYDEYLDLDG